MSYTAPIHTIPAGERLELPGEGKFVRVLEASDWFEIGLDGNTLHFIEQGLAVESAGFEKVVLYNPQVVPITVRLGIANGVIHDSRFSVPGTMPVQVENFPAAVVVADKDKPGVVAVGGNTVRFFGGLDQEMLIDPAMNTDGAIIRVASGYASGSPCYLLSKSSAPSGVQDATAHELSYCLVGDTYNLTNVYVPAGMGVWAMQSGGYAVYGSCTYDIL